MFAYTLTDKVHGIASSINLTIKYLNFWTSKWKYWDINSSSVGKSTSIIELFKLADNQYNQHLEENFKLRDMRWIMNNSYILRTLSYSDIVHYIWLHLPHLWWNKHSSLNWYIFLTQRYICNTVRSILMMICWIDWMHILQQQSFHQIYIYQMRPNCLILSDISMPAH